MSGANTSSIDDLLRRICAEYTEMPGLRVTHDQAQRLWGLDATTCHEALDRLVDAKFLTRSSSGQYARSTTGPSVRTHLQMAGAVIQKRDRRHAG